MRILSSQQIREADRFTIQNEPVSSLDLMERASDAFVTKFLGLHPEKSPIKVFCGTGNNGGDGLAIARLLLGRNWHVEVLIIGDPEKGSDDFKTNLKRLESFSLISGKNDFPEIHPGSIIIDGLFGSGLSRPLEGIHAELVKFLNATAVEKVAIDIPSGVFADSTSPEGSIAFEANCTISFQVPKLCFFLPEYAKNIGAWKVVDIGLDTGFIGKQPTNFYLSEVEELRDLIPKRSIFTHKNAVGRLRIIAGSKGKVGAAVLCARAAFKSGVGLVNVQVPKCGTNILQIAIPEAMVIEDSGTDYIEQIEATNDAVALGPGLGTYENTVLSLESFLKSSSKPMVIDADGINILSKEKEILAMVPKESILTPHPGEFKKLVGDWENDFDKLDKLRSFCKHHSLNVVLKGAYSAVCDTSGFIHFNPSGNPGLATAGSGDVLTGIIGALLAQGLKPINALKLGVYIHGAAGDDAVRLLQTEWIQASDIIDFTPHAVSYLLEK